MSTFENCSSIGQSSSTLFDTKVEELIYKIFKRRKLTLSLAESCTGGAISAKLTKVSGASTYFKGAIIAYCNAIKSRLLFVDEMILKNHGSVSKQVAIEMAKGVLMVMESDISLSITGVAGPKEADKSTPVGTVWIAIATRSGNIQSWHLSLYGSRSEIIEKAACSALLQLWQMVNGA